VAHCVLASLAQKWSAGHDWHIPSSVPETVETRQNEIKYKDMRIWLTGRYRPIVLLTTFWLDVMLGGATPSLLIYHMYDCLNIPIQRIVYVTRLWLCGVCIYKCIFIS
jgi:hypothetical protein